MPPDPDCVFQVTTGVGRVNGGQSETGFADSDGTVGGVFVEDLEQRELADGAVGIPSQALQTLSVLNPAFLVNLAGYNEIELDDPTQLGEETRRLGKWRFRISDVLAGHTLTDFLYEFRTHPYTHEIFLGETDILTAADVAAGWTIGDPILLEEFMHVQGGINTDTVEAEPGEFVSDDGGGWNFYDVPTNVTGWSPGDNRFFREFSVIRANGFMWIQGGDGETGLIEPDWAGGTPGPISDGDITWTLVPIWAPGIGVTSGDVYQPATYNGWAYSADSSFTTDTIEPTWSVPDIPVANNGRHGWRVDFVGDSLATLSILQDSSPIATSSALGISTDTWYDVQLLLQGTSGKAKLWQTGNPEPDYQVEATIDVIIGFPKTFWVDADALLIRDAPIPEVEWDEVQIAGGTSSECDDPETGFPLPPFTPGYMPIFRRQIGDPTTNLDSFICTFESGAMVLDWHTRGAVQVWGGELIPWSGRTEASIIGSGSNLGDVQQAWRHWGQHLEIRSGETWAHLMAALAEGRAVILQGDYGEFTLGERCQDDFVDNHAISLYPYQVSDRLLEGDPICANFRGIKISSLQAYAEALGAAVFGASSPQPILFAVSRPWVP